MSPAWRGTYRLQLHADFGFDAAAAIADYLAALGISHAYTSPILQAAPGSTHGYDVVDHGRVSAALGGEAGLARFQAALREHGLGHLLDIVPNHMAVAPQNQWWWDVLRHGPASPWARYFDVDWDPPENRLRNVILLPILRDQYGRVLEAGEIRLEKSREFIIRVGDHVLPVDPASLDGPLDDAAIAAINASPDALDALLERQHYRLAWWQAAQRDLGYRRFFDVNSLIGLCAEDAKVFADTHRLALEWARGGAVDGLRIDHPDGLKDPEQYLRRLRGDCVSCHIVVEKILAVQERLPASWPVDGTTGYDFMNLANALFVPPAAEAPLTAFYQEFTGETRPWPVVSHEARLEVLRDVLGSDVGRLAELLLVICENDRRHRDYSRHQLTHALRELVAWFPVYRTFVRPASGEVRDADRAVIDEAVAKAKAARDDLDPALFEFIRRMLLLELRGARESEFVLRFQQLCAPAMAKGVEDTALYRYNRFVALNEVGGDPGRFGAGPDAFHAAMAAAQARYPLTLLATDTHDAKRGLDVRSRLLAIGAGPGDWEAGVREWSAHNEKYRKDGMPDRNAEYLFYQTVVGAWPLEAGRAVAYMEKAAREAKVHTSWLNPQEPYERALRGFVEGVLGDAEAVAAIERFVARLVPAGRAISLAQLALQLTAPGVPDLYQGTELWNLSLVDPDNRRPVDYQARRALLRLVCTLTPEEIMARAAEGIPKLWLIRQVLHLRARHPESFGRDAAYHPLFARGPRADQVIAYTRGDVVTVVTRAPLSADAWTDTVLNLPEGSWQNSLTGETVSGMISPANLLFRFPVAVLERSV